MGDSPDARVPALIRRIAELEAELQFRLSRAAAEPVPSFSFPPPHFLPEIRSRRLIDRLPLLLFALTPDGTILFINAVAAAVTGFQSEEVQGRNWWNLFCPGELSGRAEEIRRLLHAGDVAGEEFVILGRNGTPIVLELTSANWYGPDGLERIVGTALVVRRSPPEEAWRSEKNYLEQRIGRLTEELRQAQTTILRYVPEGNAIAEHPEMRTLPANQNPESIGLPSGIGPTMVGEHLAEWRVRSIRKSELFSTQAAHQGERATGHEMRVTRPDGTEVTLLVNAGPTRKGERKSLGAMPLWREIARRQRAKSVGERCLAELAAIIDSIADGVLVFGPDGELLRLNQAARQLLGPAAQEFAHLPENADGWRLESPEGTLLPAEKWPPRRALAGEAVQRETVVLHSPEGTKRCLSISAAPLCRPDGPRQGAVATVSDITAWTALQEQNELYLHTISHDLRAPLTVIYGHTQLLEKLVAASGVEDQGHSSVEAIHQGIERMNAMIGDLVDAARLEGGDLGLEQEALDLREFVARLLRNSGFALEVGRIRNEIPAGLPPVSADPDRLSRILLNLLSNALKYSPPEAPVRLRAADVEGEMVMAIEDSGQGIAEKDLPNIFNRFYRLKGPRKVDSVGLGLYITKMLIEAHGGLIWVRSKVGVGSTFFFSLPKAS